MRKNVLFTIVLIMLSLTWGCHKDDFLGFLSNIEDEPTTPVVLPEAIQTFPFLETFDNYEYFDAGPEGFFYPNWWGNEILSGKLDLYSGFSLSPPYSLKFAPEGEESAVIAHLALDLSAAKHTYLSFWLATRKNGVPEDMKRTKFSISFSIDNGESFIFGSKIGPERGFENEDMAFKRFIHPLPFSLNGKSRVIVRFKSKTGGGPHLPAQLFLDNVEVAQAGSDIFPPYLIGEIRPTDLNTIRLNFSEPVLQHQAEDPKNYEFFWPEDEHGTGGHETVANEGNLPRVAKADLSPDGYQVELQLAPGLNQGDYYGLSINNLCDLKGQCVDFVIEELVHNLLEEGDLVISEVFFADPSSAITIQKLQFVEIYNPTDKVIPLGGLRIKGAISAHNMPNIKLEPGAFWVITRNAEAFEQTFGYKAWEWKGSWIQEEAEDGDAQMLFIQTTDHHSPVLVDEVKFDFLDPGWAGLVRDGYSMEVLNIGADNNLAENWRLASDQVAPFLYLADGQEYPVFATPGAVPFVEIACGEEGDKLLICHKEGDIRETLCIDREDLQEHLDHGDWMGGCEGSDEETE